MFHCFYIWFWYLYSLSLSHFFPSLYLLCQTFINCINLFKEQRRRWHPTPVLLPGKSHGQRILVGCSPWGLKELHTTDRLHFYFSLSCIGEGNGNPLQCSCLENPRDRGAWWAAVYGVTQSRTRLKWLSSSSSIQRKHFWLLIFSIACLFSISLISALYSSLLFVRGGS